MFLLLLVMTAFFKKDIWTKSGLGVVLSVTRLRVQYNMMSLPTISLSCSLVVHGGGGVASMDVVVVPIIIFFVSF